MDRSSGVDRAQAYPTDLRTPEWAALDAGNNFAAAATGLILGGKDFPILNGGR